MADHAGAYTLLGLPMQELSGQLVDLVDVLGPAGRRLGEQLHETPSWRRRFGLLDRFLLRRLDDGPRPSSEVALAWQRLVATGGAVPIGRLADEVGWSHRHLIARFHRQVGLRPKTAAGWSASTPCCGGSTRAGRWTGGGWRLAMRTSRIWSVTSAG